MRPSSSLRLAIVAGALSLAIPGVTGAPAVAQVDTKGNHPTATVASVGVNKRRLHIRSGRTVAVIGRARPAAAGLKAFLQVRNGYRWRTIDRDSTSSSGRYVLRGPVNRPMSAPARVVMRSAMVMVRRAVGRVNAYRTAYASWYGPGLYGNHLGCGGTLWPGRLGVAHKTLPCGTKVTLRHHSRVVRVRVIDRGPYVAGREYDLTEATAQRLGFQGHGPILTTR